MERRLKKSGRSAPLPLDFTKMVKSVLDANFAEGLKALSKFQPDPRFEVRGEIFPDEIVMAISITYEKRISATTFYVSTDYDPRASQPTVQDLLTLCVDALGSLISQVLDPNQPKQIEALSSDTLSALSDIPFDWTEVTFEKRKLYMLVDKANPTIDSLADDWLEKNDPKIKDQKLEEQKATEELFVTGPKKKSDDSGTIH